MLAWSINGKISSSGPHLKLPYWWLLALNSPSHCYTHCFAKIHVQQSFVLDRWWKIIWVNLLCHFYLTFVGCADSIQLQLTSSSKSFFEFQLLISLSSQDAGKSFHVFLRTMNTWHVLVTPQSSILVLMQLDDSMTFSWLQVLIPAAMAASNSSISRTSSHCLDDTA